jgi:hypothetical protein
MHTLTGNDAATLTLKDRQQVPAAESAQRAGPGLPSAQAG